MGFRERTSSFSLEYREIRLSAIFGARGKTVLRGKGFAWVPDLGSFFKLLEVGFSPYLGFIPIFSTFRMFESIEAIKGYLIGLKPWDRINIKILRQNGAARGCSTVDVGVKLCVFLLIMY